VQGALLRSRFVGIRRRGYKSVSNDKAPDVSLVKLAWQENRDPECAWLLVKLLPAGDLAPMKAEILPRLKEGWKLSRLFLKLAEFDRSAPDELERLDHISFCYVLAKIGRTISNEKAKDFVERSATDERLGLLVWSIGKMGLWEVLVWIQQNLPEIQIKKYAHLAPQDAQSLEPHG